MKEKIIELKSKLKDYWSCYIHTELPPALNKISFNRILISIVVVFACVLASIFTKNAGFLLGMIISLFLFWKTLALSYDYEHKVIKEYVYTCMAIKINRYTKQTELLFQDYEGNTHKYIYSNKRSSFFENIKYRLYISDNNPKVIIAYNEE